MTLSSHQTAQQGVEAPRVAEQGGGQIGNGARPVHDLCEQVEAETRQDRQRRQRIAQAVQPVPVVAVDAGHGDRPAA
ncbi:MAG TPA: hypothetical protein QGF95_01730 [Candidatus Latescibacteria bacterium]|nr:hypothetical protein [Candidatus Latescibacterota bacterium]HJP29255.1 hypothetical protein [Candidatus Latescibacterota bacterium]